MAKTNGSDTYEVVILGAGYAGLMAALRLAGRNRLSRVALINDGEHFVERIRQQERVSGPVAARLPPLAVLLSKTKVDFINGHIAGLDPLNGRVQINTAGGPRQLTFDHCIYALGSHIDEDAVPGVADHAYRLDPGGGPRSVPALRSQLEARAGTAVRVVVVGGANTATEAAGEIKATWPAAAVTMVSRSRAGNFKKGASVERKARAALLRLGIRLIDGQTVSEIRPDEVITEAGMRIPAEICVWAGGLRAAPTAGRGGVAVDRQDRIWVDPTLRSISHPRILAVGDAAHPIAPTGADYRLSAFAALVTGAYAADSLIDRLERREPSPFSYSTYGQGVAIGRAGIGFFTYPNDRDAYFILTGRTAFHLRNLFVWALIFFLRLERRYPGSFFWLGRRRISWSQAMDAMHRGRALTNPSIGDGMSDGTGVDLAAAALHPAVS